MIIRCRFWKSSSGRVVVSFIVLKVVFGVMNLRNQGGGIERIWIRDRGG